MNIRQEGIIKGELGIIEKKGIYFHNASEFAQKYLFYGLWGAEYVCQPPYQVKRKGLDLLQIFYIRSGEMHFNYRGQNFIAKKDDVVLIDCNHPHHYYAGERVQYYWFHFHGSASIAYANLIWNKSGSCFSGQQALEQDFRSILLMLPMEENCDDRISYTIHHILAALNAESHAKTPISPEISKAIIYMKTHAKENISIDDIAASVSMSRFYFSRRFHGEVGLSPHEYLMNLRISYAKNRLSASNDSIEQIALDCAFSSSSNFIRAFKKSTGVTPFRFRIIVHGME